ncbi:hypothetical protein [Streptomyces sp. NPDC058155]|uniref:hypothetical protein n=1 Tax=Streptomyces sp. NPDC058155 TaxID=3346359 RepID=UPI0036F0CFB6
MGPHEVCHFSVTFGQPPLQGGPVGFQALDLGFAGVGDLSQFALSGQAPLEVVGQLRGSLERSVRAPGRRCEAVLG